MEPCRPLRYRISAWRQLPECKSNYSADLKIVVTEFITDPRLTGTRIKVEHSTFGTLFACLINPSGSIVHPLYNVNEMMTPDNILAELAKFGFFIEYNVRAHLPGNMVQYLMTLDSLHFDKIRIMGVWEDVLDRKEFKTHIVAFKSSAHGQWLNNDYAPHRKEFLAALDAGTALNVSAISKCEHYNWTWLYGYVANIPDVLKENAEVPICPRT